MRALEAALNEDSRPSVPRVRQLTELVLLLARQQPLRVAKTKGVVEFLVFHTAERPLTTALELQRDRMKALLCLASHSVAIKVLLTLSTGADLFRVASAALALHDRDSTLAATVCELLAVAATTASEYFA